MMWAIDDVEKTKLLLDAGAELDARSNDGRTALTIAAARVGATDVVRLLLDRGAKLTSAPQLPMSDTFLGDAESLDLLLPLQGKATGLAAAVRMRCLKCLDVMLKFAEPGDLSAALSTAASMGDTAAFRKVGGFGSSASESGRGRLYDPDACERGRACLTPKSYRRCSTAAWMSMLRLKLARRLSTTRSATEIHT